MRGVSRWRRRILLLVSLLLILAASRHAWAQAGTSSVLGAVRDEQGAVIPGASVVLTSTTTGAERTTVTDSAGNYQFMAVQPGTYKMKVELQGFRTAIRDNVQLRVDTATRLEGIVLSVGALTEAVEVQAQALVVNTTDASLGNVINSTQIMALPLEARNPVGLMSLQPGAVFLPTGDDRSGAVSGARSDQANVTLDGVDVNDPELGTAFTTVLRMPLDAIQEFRVTTTNYSADQGRSSGGQVSLITKTGTNKIHGAGYWTVRNTATSSNEYFLKLSQLQSGAENKAPKLDKNIFGGALGGPIKRDRLFLYANYEQLREMSESPVMRAVPSETLRDGILQYRCASAAACPGGSVTGLSGASYTIQPGFYGLSPAQLKAIDPLGIGANIAVSDYWKQYPKPNDPGSDGVNFMAFRFAAPIENQFKTFVTRADYNLAANHRLFGRVNVMRDALNAPPQFPDQPPRSTQEVRNWGIAAGYDWVIGSNRVNTLRYGFTQIKNDTIGQLQSNVAQLRFIDDFKPPTSSNGREVPTHNIIDDFSWINGGHTLKFGTNIRITRNNRYTDGNSYHFSVANGSWVAGNGRFYIPGRPSCTTPGCFTAPATASSFYAAYADPFIDILGVLSETDAVFNFDRDGNALPNGAPVTRRFASDEYEMYAMDSWRVKSNLTLTAGVRWSVYSPPWETNGLQVAPTVNLGEWFDQRGANAAKGIPANAMPPFQFDLAGKANGKKGFYDWQYKNFAPRVSVAWTPNPKGGWLKALTGGDKTVLRGGYSLVYDRVGYALATTYDANGAYGLSTGITTPWATANETTPGVRFVSPTTMPPNIAAAPKGGFPYEPPLYSGTIAQSMDASVKTPYAHMINAVFGRELPGNFALEAAYVGRFGRRLLVRRDLAMPVNLVDTKSGASYFQAAQALIRAAQAAGISTDAGSSAYKVLSPIAYWENLFPDAAQGGLTATQNIAMTFNSYAPDYMTAFYNLDEFCDPACSIYGPFAYFSPQFDALVGQSSVGRSDYNSLQLTLRKRWSRNYQFDVNYTMSKSEDLGSSVERGAGWGTQGFGGYSGVLMNPWEPDLQWGASDFDVRHQVNFNWVANLPFGKGRKWGRDASGVVNTLIGDWSVAGLMRWTSGFPFNVINCRSCWVTNWQLQGNAELVTPGVLPPTSVTKDTIDHRPSAFVDPVEALKYFRFDLPGEVGIRNLLRGDGYFGIDLSVSKGWNLPYGMLRFRWDTFNLTNTPRFDTSQVTMTPDRPGFGRYNGTLATCDGRAGRCMQFALHYEF